MNEAVKTDRRSSLAAEQLRLCGLCEASAGPSKGELGLLVGPFAVDKNTHQGKEFFVHKSCALWSPEVGVPRPSGCTRLLPQLSQILLIPRDRYFWTRATIFGRLARLTSVEDPPGDCPTHEEIVGA